MKRRSRILSTLVFLGALTGIALAGTALFGSSSAFAKSACPDKKAGETAEDCPWAGISRDLDQVAAKHGSVLKALKKEAPGLYSRMLKDSHRKDWLNLWGKSINFDEYAKVVIVHPATVKALLALFQPPSGPAFMEKGRQIVHAGIEHNYGYLFSNVVTPWGYKRARWVRQTLDRGFGLPVGTLTPLPKMGTLFSNVTYFAGHIAFRNEPAVLKILEKDSKGVSPALIHFKYKSLKPERLEETIHTQTGDVVIRTDLVPFLHPVQGDKNTHWLVYSVWDHRKGGPKTPQLITAFPVETSFLKVVFNPKNLGENKPIITRYNGYVDGISFSNHTGTRRKL